MRNLASNDISRYGAVSIQRVSAVILFAAAWFALSLNANAQQVPATYFGLTDLFAGLSVSWATPAPVVPFGAIRLWDTSTDWKLVEPSRGVYEWGTLDSWISLAESRGVPVEFTFGRTPSWAASADNLPPTNMQDWDDFVRAVATRYKGRIEAYETWNEVNSPFYTGRMSEMVTMQQHAYSIIKSVDPTAIVLSPSFAGGGMGDLNRFLAAGAAKYIDGAAVHVYPWPQTSPTPEANILDWIDTYRKDMANYGVGDKPIWNTEYGWGLNFNLPNASDQAAFLARSYLLWWSKGIARTYWYAYDNSGWGTLRVSNSGTPGTLTEAGIAYNTVYNWMVGATMTQPCAVNTSGTWTCAFTRPGSYRALAIWHPAGPLSTPTPSGFSNYWTLDGHRGALGSVITIGATPLLLESTASGSAAAALLNHYDNATQQKSEPSRRGH